MNNKNKLWMKQTNKQIAKQKQKIHVAKGIQKIYPHTHINYNLYTNYIMIYI